MKKMGIMMTDDFLAEFKRKTEENWSHTSINPHLYGFQFQPDTRWNPGLSDREITEYEGVLNVRFPGDFKVFLRAMNGTDLLTLNVYGYSGEQHRHSLGVYSYPKDLEAVQLRIEEVEAYRSQLTATLADQRFALAGQDFLMPICIHRYVVCRTGFDRSAVLSIADGDDAIVYGNSLEEYLENEFLRPLADHHK